MLYPIHRVPKCCGKVLEGRVKLISFLGKLREDPIMVSSKDAKIRVSSKIVSLLKGKLFMGWNCNAERRGKFRQSAEESGIRDSLAAAVCS